MSMTTESETEKKKSGRPKSALTLALEALKGTELDGVGSRRKLGTLSPEDQKRITEDLLAGNMIGARVRLKTTDRPVQEGELRYHTNSMNKAVRAEIQRLTAAWDNASEETKHRFVRRLAKRRVPAELIPSPKD